MSSALRSLAFLLFQLIVTPLYAVAMVLMFWSPRLLTYRMAANWCAVNLWGARWICGIRWRVDGLMHIPADTRAAPHIVISKHSSTWETLALTQYFPPLAYVAKKELLSIPFFGWGFALASPITIDRRAGTDAMQQMVAQGRARFGQGFWIVVYPEGTRTRAGTRAKYKTGGARLAIAMDVPIIPVAHNAGHLWPKGLFGKRPGAITMTIGRPIVPTGRDPASLMQEIEAWIEGEVARLGEPA
ncbi:MAG: 1-acyl-sn-glycerol-3-phosphate acyltransferase [Burkholderiales bacterium]|nr:1-acyl-sn-glycerol-3-phosphate acyltransferase [Burkholderiales bacterium]